MKTFGHSIAIQTSGPDAVEDFEETLGQARDMAARSISESMKACHYLGYRIDPDTVTVDEWQEPDRYIIRWRMMGEQTVPLLKRLWKAVRA